MSRIEKKSLVESIDIVVGIDKDREKINFSLNKNNGYLFVSGGKGSGKTTFVNRLVKTIEHNYSPMDVQVFDKPLDALFVEVKKRKEKSTVDNTVSFPLLVCVLDDIHAMMLKGNGNPNSEMSKTFLDKILRMNPHEVGVFFVLTSSWFMFTRSEDYREYIFTYFDSYIFFGGISCEEFFHYTGVPLDYSEDQIAVGHGLMINPNAYEDPVFFC